MNKKTIMLIITAIVISAVLIFLPNKNTEKQEIPKGAPVAAATVSERVNYFASHGWEVEEITGKTVTIPRDFSEIYEEYALLQDKQGLPLREYAGKDATLYIYEVKNYSPESRKMLAELLVCNDTAVASMVYSEDGGSLKLSVI